MNDVNRSHLPIRRPAFSGTVRKTLAGSPPDWALVSHPRPPEGTPNVLLVLIDDAGFGNPSTFEARPDPELHPHGSRGISLQPVPRHRAVLADPCRAADGAQQPRCGLRFYR